MVRPSLGSSLAWMDRARCTEYDDDYSDSLFFSEQSSTGTGRRHMREAVRCCLLCPVRLECWQQALAHDPEVVGIWAATTETERRMTLGLPDDVRIEWLDRVARGKASEVLTRSETPAA
jgi:hypothetical protein